MLGDRDPAFIRRWLPAVTGFVNLFSPEVRGTENLPATGPVLVIGNHSGLYYMPDAWLVGLEIVRRRGIDQPAYALAYDLLFSLPKVGPFLRRIGAIPANGAAARAALEQRAAVVVYPGGDREACRPWTARNRIDFGGRTGFVRLALQAGVPVVPVVAHGAHDTVIVLWRGERLARVLGLRRLRIDVLPLLLGPPLGLTPILTPPMPAAITVEFLPPMGWHHLGPDAATDDAVVDRCYREISATMQTALDRLHRELAPPLAAGLANLLRGRPRRVSVPSA